MSSTFADEISLTNECYQMNLSRSQDLFLPLRYLPFFLFLIWISTSTFAQISNEDLRTRVTSNKNDLRGPYKDIRWFCKDGSIRQPRDPCPEEGGHQRARYKDEVIELGTNQHIYLGQILATTAFSDFWDRENNNSRMKQYILERYLQSIDDGWISQKAKFYRGAIQREDEIAWGSDFLVWLLENKEIPKQQFFLIKQATRFIPHYEEETRAGNIRSISKNLSDSIPEFQNLRIKIHGQPEASDIDEVKAFYRSHQVQLSSKQKGEIETLIKEMEATYKPTDLSEIQKLIHKIPKDRTYRQDLLQYVEPYLEKDPDQNFTLQTAEKLGQLRLEILNEESARVRLILFDVANALEDIYFLQSTRWKPETPQELGEKICYTAKAAMGCGYLEIWEWDQIEGNLANYSNSEMVLSDLQNLAHSANAALQWSSSMVGGVYNDIVSLYTAFEPLAEGFIDDKIRSSILLPLGSAVGQLSDFTSSQSNLSNQVLDLSNQNNIRGLNPGIAKGKLEIITGTVPDELDKTKIYVFHHPPSDLKPVAGIMTVNEGNMVSHVQLLARNLAIPNASISAENLNQLVKHNHQEVFYAVANNGRVILKNSASMSEDERQLFIKKERKEEKVKVPVEKIDLHQQSVINMRSIDATASGKICGPKAANLAQLKTLFPNHVVEGIVLPFGIFRAHLDQKMPSRDLSYWEFIQKSFEQSDSVRKHQNSESADKFILGKLSELREAIKQIQFSDAFVRDLEQGFKNAFGKDLGSVPVFLRSDTNMEDLKDFTGAGLNLTVFNVVSVEEIFKGIRDVWASPYTERSFGWRQRYLINPENVFPSILIIPSVDVQASGVMITKGVNNGQADDITIAFSRGAGGAVDGQAAESYLLHHNGTNELLAPSRETKYRRLPPTGGTSTNFATFNERILSESNLFQLRQIAAEIKKIMPGHLQLSDGTPMDVELGFKDNAIWLFQIRPFVENKNAQTINYLEKLAPQKSDSKVIKMASKI
ncbi:MAG: phosphoenolpyruvate synthase [Saprospiraceae bacterium]|nr:phosphoenolpyruvate synthase [Saprospiraceae bacterium]